MSISWWCFWWAVDVFFVFLKTHQQNHTLNSCFCQPVFCVFCSCYITPYMMLLIDYPSTIAYNGIIRIPKWDNNSELWRKSKSTNGKIYAVQKRSTAAESAVRDKRFMDKHFDPWDHQNKHLFGLLRQSFLFVCFYADTRFFSTCGGFIIRINAPTETIKKFIMPPSRENSSSTVFACVLTEKAWLRYST